MQHPNDSEPKKNKKILRLLQIFFYRDKLNKYKLNVTILSHVNKIHNFNVFT